MSLATQIKDEFLDVRLAPRNVMIYAPRTTILRAVRSATQSFYGEVLDIGCGFMPYRAIICESADVTKYTGMDLETPTYYANVEPDLKWNGQQIPLADNSVDCIMATEFLEHYAEPETIMLEISRVLRPNGRFFATVPFIWNLHEVPYDEYRYTPFSLRRIVEGAGIGDIEIRALGGWNMALAQHIGIWLTFSPMRASVRSVMKVLLFPVFALLVKTDHVPRDFDGHSNSMFNGLSITGTKK
jgi:SAM-dependent methyltransferase